MCVCVCVCYACCSCTCYLGGRFQGRLQQNISIVNTSRERCLTLTNQQQQQQHYRHATVATPFAKNTLVHRHQSQKSQQSRASSSSSFAVVVLAAIKAFLACLMFILQFKFAFIWSFSFYTPPLQKTKQNKTKCKYNEN